MSKQELWQALFKQGADIGAHFPVLYRDTQVGYQGPHTGTWAAWESQRVQWWIAQVKTFADDGTTQFEPSSPDWIILCGNLIAILEAADILMTEPEYEQWYESYKDVLDRAGMLG